MHRIILIFGILHVFAFSVFSQSGDFKKANEFLSNGNFEAALDELTLLLEDQPGNMRYNYLIGVCYLNTNFKKEGAIEYLKKVINSGKYDNNALYLLGRAYHYNHQFDDAISLFNKYKNEGGGTAATKEDAERQIQFCYNAKELIKYPLNVQFENLGDKVNSPNADYFPFVPADESFLVFNSRRQGDEELPNGAFTSSIYRSLVNNGEYSQAEKLDETINTNTGDEEVIGLSANGNIMLMLFNNEKSSGDLFITNKRGSGFEKPVVLDDNINSKAQEIAASITRDGNTLFFASDRRGGVGGTDIYMCKKLPIGGWGPAQSVGDIVNTGYNEDFPTISPDGKTLYFSSKGHTSMGGYDIFTAQWNEQTKRYEKVRNLGYPINTTLDDMNFRISETGRYGYIAAIRPEGKGDYDIYRVTFNEVETRYTVIKGIIKSTDSTAVIDDVLIDVTDKATGDLYGAYLPNFNTMRYIFILPPGEYNVFVDVPGHKPIDEDIKVLDKASFQAEIEKDIILSPN